MFVRPARDIAEAGVDFDLVAVNLREKTLADGSDYLAINPRGYVPFLERDDGQTLAECAVIIQYIADQKPESGWRRPLERKSGTGCRNG